jgi:hypothetical protein
LATASVWPPAINGKVNARKWGDRRITKYQQSVRWVAAQVFSHVVNQRARKFNPFFP